MAIIQPFPALPIQAAKLSVTEKLLINNFINEKGFFNPLAILIGQVKSSASAAAITLTAAAALPEPILGYEPLTSADLTAIASALSALASSCDSYLEHTDRLTGVTFNDSVEPPDLSGLLAIANGYNSAKESMRNEGDPIVDNFSPIFWSLVSGEAEKLLTEALSITQNIGTLLSTGNRVANANVIRSFAARASGGLSRFITTDNANYTTAKNWLRKYGTAISLNASFISDDWSYFYAFNNVGDSKTTKPWIQTIRAEKSLSDTLAPSGYTGSASTLRTQTIQ